MAHKRDRLITALALKSLKAFPVLILQGARQTGKSYLSREILAKSVPHSTYITLDKQSDREFATKNPDSFLSQRADNELMIIDEAQKAPALFDAVKLKVDERKSPGQFLLLGSTEFSRLSRVRESLTGRAGRIRLFPLNLAEACSKDISFGSQTKLIQFKAPASRQELVRHLARGGFPGIFSARSLDLWEQHMGAWIDLTVERDIHMFPKFELEPDIARRLLQLIARIEEPTLANLAKLVSVSARRVESYLKVLKELFVIHPLQPHHLGTGKTLWYLCDTGLATFLGANFERQLETWVLHELLVRNSLL